MVTLRPPPPPFLAARPISRKICTGGKSPRNLGLTFRKAEQSESPVPTWTTTHRVVYYRGPVIYDVKGSVPALFKKLHHRGETGRKGRECKIQNKGHRTFDIRIFWPPLYMVWVRFSYFGNRCSCMDSYAFVADISSHFHLEIPSPKIRSFCLLCHLTISPI